MKVEYKSVAVGGVTEVKDEGDGVVTAYVSITGVKDNVNDIIEPGAYTDTLKKRTPKGVWGHSWTTPTSKTLDAKELMPGDAELPKELSDGTPWPKEAGALKIKMQFNLGTTRGREAYSDVKFFGPQQEWSIGYSVPDGMSHKSATTGVRHIKKLDLFEYSAVLFGAMSHARTKSVADAQIGMKLLEGVSATEIKSLEEAVAQFRKDNVIEAPETVDTDFVGDDVEDALDESDDAILDIDDESEEIEEEEEFDADEDYEDDDPDEEEVEEEAVKLLAANMDVSDLRQAYDVIGKVLDVLNPDHAAPDYIEMGFKALIEAKATGYDTISEAVEAIDVSLDPSDAKALQDAAADLDDALDNQDTKAAEKAVTTLLDTLEAIMDEVGDDEVSLKAVARAVVDKGHGKPGDEDDEDDYSDGEDEEDDWEDEEEEDKVKKKSFTFNAANGIEYKSVPFAGREFGAILGGEDLEAKERMNAYVSTLPNTALIALNETLSVIRGNNGLKTYVGEEISSREYAGVLSTEEKNSVRHSMGQQGRGGGRHRQAAEGRTAGPGRNFGETGAVKKPSAKRLKRANKGIKKPGRSKKVINKLAGARKPVAPLLGKSMSTTETKRDFPAKKRGQMAESGTAMVDGSFPIANEKDLKNAIRACGRAKDQDAAKAHIKKRAKALGKESLLPDDWKTVQINTVELKSLAEFVRGI